MHFMDRKIIRLDKILWPVKLGLLNQKLYGSNKIFWLLLRNFKYLLESTKHFDKVIKVLSKFNKII